MSQPIQKLGNSSIRQAKCQAAFFDLDSTILDMHTMILFAQYLGKKKVVKEQQVIEMLSAVKNAEKNGASREKTNGLFFTILSGIKQDNYLELGFQWWNSAEKKLLSPVYQEYEKLKINGDHVVAISGSYSCCVQAIGESLGMTAWYGSEPEINNRILTGAVRVAMVGDCKRRKVLEYLSTHSENIISSLAFGDHPSDFPMLSAVNSACYVHSYPIDAASLSYAKTQGWRLIDVSGNTVTTNFASTSS
ncbi:haloacid dehalogenase [Xenorhabdus stockiae]|uniref:Haloacid dehalogenase n=1 Tax=Xenorhabdus stockiae TaxID=351614 RepID=A0A2D0KSG3_9GAMM|nr:HAD-IB family phosphatase [Xenorhabdus stockiae]PHM66370.1 haloacid dehalogenase [Xenorhabdus stockiae]